MSSAVEVVPVEGGTVQAPSFRSLVDLSYEEVKELLKAFEYALNPVIVSSAMLNALKAIGYGHQPLKDVSFGPGAMTQLYNSMKQEIKFKPVGCAFPLVLFVECFFLQILDDPFDREGELQLLDHSGQTIKHAATFRDVGEVLKSDKDAYKGLSKSITDYAGRIRDAKCMANAVELFPMLNVAEFAGKKGQNVRMSARLGLSRETAGGAIASDSGSLVLAVFACSDFPEFVREFILGRLTVDEMVAAVGSGRRIFSDHLVCVPCFVLF